MKLLIAAMILLDVASAFSPVVWKRTTAVVLRAKGFSPIPEPKPEKPPSEEKQARIEAQSKLAAQVASGVPEYAVFARTFGSDEKSWLQVGTIACPRTEKPDKVILGNEGALITGLLKAFPKMKGQEGNLEYGYRLKKFTDDPVRLVMRQSPVTEGNAVLKWFASLTNPINTDDVKK